MIAAVVVEESRRRRPGRTSVSLVCMVCGSRNYKTTKPRREGLSPLVLKKHCKVCNQHTEHREAK